jgi:hypothetical protein
VAIGRRFGVAAVDRGLGDIPKGSLVLVRHDPGVEANAFTLQAAGAHVTQGRPVVYAVTDRSPTRVREGIADHVRDPEDSRILLLDAHSALLGTADKVDYRVDDPTDLLQVVARLEQAARDNPEAILVVDSMSSLLDHADEARFLAIWPRILAAVRRFQFTIALWTSWPYGEDVEKTIAQADAVVRLRAVEEGVMLHHSLAVERAAWGKSPPGPPVLYKIDRPGGVMVYVPKVVVIGPAGAGKTTFVHTVSEKATSVDRMGTTVAVDRGTATLDGIKIEVWGTPGQDRFDPLLATLASQATGAILVVDATMATSFTRARSMLDKVWRRGLRAIIALNKSDLAGALSPEQARKKLAAPDGVAIVACTATDKDSATAVLRQLVDTILLAPPGGAA